MANTTDAPWMSGGNFYSSVPLPNARSIRLLQIHPPQEDGSICCSLKPFELLSPSKPQHHAISYTWGPPTYQAAQNGMTNERCCPIICNGQVLLITENLLHCLYHVTDESLYLWIDAICINQDDIAERNSQILMMTEIYATAKMVIVWLGEEDIYTQPAIRLLDVLGSMPLQDLLRMDPLNPLKAEHSEISGLSIDESDWNALSQFFQRSWFNRIWILQEVVAPNQCIVICGTYLITWNLLNVVSSYLISTSFCPTRPLREDDKQAAATTSPLPIRMGNSMAAIMMLWHKKRNQHDEGQLQSVLEISRSFQSSDPRDKVYAVLGLCKGVHRGEIIPDYAKTVADVYIEVTEVLLRTSKNLNALSMVEDRLYRNRDDLPSWVPDYSAWFHNGIANMKQGVYSASKGLCPEWTLQQRGRILSIRAAKIGQVAMVGETKRSLIETWSSWTWLHILVNMPKTYANGQNTIEAFWRTLIGDACNERDCSDNNELETSTYRCPAPTSLEASFRDWFAFHVGHGFAYSRRSGEDHLSQAIANLDQLSANDPVGLIPSVDEINQFANVWLDPPQAFLDSRIDIIKLVRPYERAIAVIPEARFFTTSEGLMGIGPVSLLAEDCIWLIPRAEVLFIFRKRSGGDRYEFVGDAYVHGLMHGEAVEDAVKNMTTVELERAFSTIDE